MPVLDDTVTTQFCVTTRFRKIYNSASGVPIAFYQSEAFYLFFKQGWIPTAIYKNQNALTLSKSTPGMSIGYE